MELIAVTFMLVAGAAVAAGILLAASPGTGHVDALPVSPASERETLAVSLLLHVVLAGGTPESEAVRQVRGMTGLAAAPARGIDLANWGERYAQLASRGQRERLLELAARLVSESRRTVPLFQYVALLDLSFSLGFQTDALARLRSQYGFEYVDHARAERPGKADRSGLTTLFERNRTDTSALLAELELQGPATRQDIVAAYRRIAARNHPDRYHDAGEAARNAAAARFIALTRAYEALLAIVPD